MEPIQRKVMTDFIEQLDLDRMPADNVQMIIDACFSELQRRNKLRTVNRKGKIQTAWKSPKKSRWSQGGK
jgi:hypothetical protein